MSDLLTRLAERALRLAPAVQPLLRSPYAGDPAAAIPQAAGTGPEAETASEAPAALRDPAVSASSPPANAAAAARPGASTAPAPSAPAPRPAPSSSPAAGATTDGLLLPPLSVDPLPPIPSDLVPRAASPSTAWPVREGATAAVDDAPPHARAHSVQPGPGTPHPAEGAAPAPTGKAPASEVGARPQPAGRAPTVSPPQPFAGEGETGTEDGLLLPLRPAAESAITARDGETGRQRPSGPARAGTAGPPASAARPGREANAEAVETDEAAPSVPDRGLRSARPPAPVPPVGDDGEGAPVERAAGAVRGEEARPVVRVSIGRIEVRGPPPPEAPGRLRPAWTPPVLSLADYLKRGAGR